MAFGAVICTILLLLVSTHHSTESSSSSGLPSKPFAVRTQFVDIDLYDFHVYWKVELRRPDVDYLVEVCPGKCRSSSSNCGRFSCTRLVPHLEYDCFIDEVEYEHCFRNVTVLARNTFGEVRSDPVLVRKYVAATPLAPTILYTRVVESTGKKAAVYVSWKGKSIWTSYENSIYELVFHAEGGKNETQQINITESNTVLSDLQIYQTYFIYLRAQIVDYVGIKSNFGPFCERVKFRTPEGVPDSPEVLSDEEQVFLEDNRLRNVTLTLKIPSPDAWRGRPKEIQIHYSRFAHGNETERGWTKIDTATSVNQTVLERLNSTDQYLVQLKACNGMHCSALGTGYKIEAAAVPPDGSSTSRRADLEHIFSIAVPTTIAVVALITMYSLWRCYRRGRPNDHNVHPDFAQWPNVRVEVGHYNEVASTNNSNDYDSVSFSEPHAV